MNESLTQLAEGGITLLVLIAFAIVASIILFLLRKYNVTLKGLFGNSPIMNEVIDSVSQLIQETVIEIAKSISEKYQNDGVITKEELALIKVEAVSIIIKKLDESQSSIIQSIHGDILEWISGQVEVELDKLIE